MDHADCSQLYFSWAAREDFVATASPPLIVRTCKHLLESGGFCQAAAVAGRSYCRAHVLLRSRCRKMARARRRARRVKLPSLMDQQSIRAGMVQVRVAFAAGHIDAGLARLLSYAMRQAATNLRFIAQQEKLAFREDAAQIGPRSLGLGGAPPERIMGRTSGESEVTSAPRSGVGRSIARAPKSKPDYRIRITSCESNGYDRNTS